MSLCYLYLPISSSLVNWMTRWCKLETRHHHNLVLTSSTAACFLGCLKLNLCFQGLGGRFSGPGVLNIVSGSRVALVAFSLLLLFMPLYRSMAASSALAQTSMVEMETGGKSTGLWRSPEGFSFWENLWPGCLWLVLSARKVLVIINWKNLQLMTSIRMEIGRRLKPHWE